MDVRHMDFFQDESFECVIDKGNYVEDSIAIWHYIS